MEIETPAVETEANTEVETAVEEALTEEGTETTPLAEASTETSAE